MNKNQPQPNNYEQYLAGGGEMGELIRSFDWSSKVLGTPDKWSPNLLTTLGIILNSPFPMFLWWEDDLIQFYNDAYRPSLGNNGKHPKALGQRGEECWPEIWPVIKPLIDGVLSMGKSTWSENQLIPIYRNNRLEDAYWTFSYSKVIDETGRPGGVLAICTETTEQVIGRKRIIDLTEEQANINQELAASNEELVTTNEELIEMQEQLRGTLSQVELSKLRFQTLVCDANIGIIVLMGAEARVEIVNEAYTKLIGRNVKMLLGRLLFDIIPETEAYFRPIIDKVRLTGETIHLYDTPYTVFSEGTEITGYLNLVYQPYREDHHTITGVIVLCQDVTEQVQAKMKMQTAYEQLRLSKEAAQLGSFDMDMIAGTMEWDARCRELFGISHQDSVTYEKDFVTGLHPEDKDRIIEIIDKVFVKAISNGVYDVEYRTVGAEDKQVRWVRAKGQAYFNEHDEPTRFIGSVLDITEQKLDEQRKNDFIGMVSHELKTPLTSLTANVQMLKLKANKNEDAFTATALEMANKQVKKMTSMINGFLNVSRLESGKIYIDKQLFDIAVLMQETEEEARAAYPNNEIVFSAVEQTMVLADRDKIGQVIENLISNAVKYSQPESTVYVLCETKGEHVRVSVQDEGVGIAEIDINRIFERYYRAENIKSTSISGFGIGLYLSAEIIHRHAGKIGVKSEVGKGSEFWFSLPLAH